MTPVELAKFLRVSPSTVRRLYREGKLPPPIDVAQQIRFMPDEVINYLRRKS
jgi:excisionase family DNA binding protein